VIHHESITCPYCWESIEIEVDLSVEAQQYVEDCFVCCRPIAIAYRTEEDGSVSVDAAREGDE
jgi:hypothetical protein